jgi:hypothetical protein
MKLRRKAWGLVILLCLGLLQTSAIGATKLSKKSRSMSKSNPKSGSNPKSAKKRKSPGNALSEKVKERRMVAQIRSGKERWEHVGTYSGRFPITIIKRRQPILVELDFPHTEAGHTASVTRLGGGEVSALGGRGRSAKSQDVANVLVARTTRGGKVSFKYEFGEALHDQRVQVRVGQQLALFEFHLHDGSDAHQD